MGYYLSLTFDTEPTSLQDLTARFKKAGAEMIPEDITAPKNPRIKAEMLLSKSRFQIPYAIPLWIFERQQNQSSVPCFAESVRISWGGPPPQTSNQFWRPCFNSQKRLAARSMMNKKRHSSLPTISMKC